VGFLEDERLQMLAEMAAPTEQSPFRKAGETD